VRAALLAPALAALLLAAPAGAREAAAAGGALAVYEAGAWRTFWRADRAPERWGAPDSTVTRALEWKPLTPGLEWASLKFACGAPVWRARLIVARLDPRVLRLSLVMDLDRARLAPAWSIERAPDDALLAVNAGQFGTSLPWGWVVIDGVEHLSPGHAPLASVIAIDRAGGVRWAHGDTLANPAGVVSAFQSYPTLLAGDGVVPAALRTRAAGMHLSHRDARLALGSTRDGRLLIAMSRFDAVGEIAEFVPLGPTTPEMAAIMGALGACDAVMLDGGISAQMTVRDPARRTPLAWHGMRKVPLALIARARAPAPGAAPAAR
jgi:phosphodiester glycosidase